MAIYENMMWEIQEKLLRLALLQNLPIFLSFRIQHKMNIIKENKDLACFYTTKHSWRGK